jgi:hypothetical protein
MPDGFLGMLPVSTSASLTVVAGVEGLPFPFAEMCSVNVFHSPHDGHRPSHLGWVVPHSEQINIVFVLAI